MRIRLGTVELDDGVRRQIAEYYGRAGLASHDTCANFIRGNGLGALDDLNQIEDRER